MEQSLWNCHPELLECRVDLENSVKSVRRRPYCWKLRFLRTLIYVRYIHVPMLHVRLMLLLTRSFFIGNLAQGLVLKVS